MGRRELRVLWAALAALVAVAAGRLWVSSAAAQSLSIDGSTIRVRVELVQMNVAVTDKKGNYVNGLGPEDFQIVEDRIPEQLATFEEGDQVRQVLVKPARSAAAPPAIKEESAGAVSPIDLRIPPPVPSRAAEPLAGGDALSSDAQGSNVFLLFDTSDYMYRDFSSAEDSMASFVHSLGDLDRVAFYSYSRNLSRRVALTKDRLEVVRGLHSVSAGDDDALFSSMLLTLQEANRSKGKRVLVVFSHGPDNASSIGPEEVSELAQSEGVPVYMVSTGKAQLDPMSRLVFERLSSSSGGQAYFAENKEAEQKSFASIREDLAHLYTLSYYPRYNSNLGWRTITVKLKDGEKKGFTIRTRSGYRPGATDAAADDAAPAE